MKESFGWAYIGCGSIAHKTASEILKSGRHQIVTVTAGHWERARAFAGRFGGEAVEQAQDAMTHPKVEGVYIATPHSAHLELARQAIELGKPVLVEKPAVVNVQEFDQLSALAGERGVYLCEAMWTRFGPVAKQVQQWVREGEIGTITKITASFATFPPFLKKPERLMRPELAGGVLLDMGIYPLTYAHMLLGMPREIQCRTDFTKTGVDARDEMTLRYPNGAQCRLYASILDQRLPVAKILGTKGRISVPGYWYGSSAALRGYKKTVRAALGGGYLYEFDKVAQDIRAGKLESEEVPHRSSREVLEMMDACRRQVGLAYPFETQ